MKVLLPTMKMNEFDFHENTRLVCFPMVVKRPSLKLRQTGTHHYYYYYRVRVNCETVVAMCLTTDRVATLPPFPARVGCI